MAMYRLGSILYNDTGLLYIYFRIGEILQIQKNKFILLERKHLYKKFLKRIHWLELHEECS